MKKLLSVFTLIWISILGYTQQSQTVINGWNAYVHLPASYNSGSTTYPTIIFFPGLGEVGANAGAIISNGPGAYIAQGWNGNVLVDGNTVEFIVISLQPPAAYPNEALINARIQAIKTLYRVNPDRLYLTGLSHGGWCATTYVTGDIYGGPYTYASQIAAVVEMQGMVPDDNSPYPGLFDNYAKAGGRLLGFEQTNDGRGIPARVDRMNTAKAGSAIFKPTTFGDKGHGYWNEFYGGQGLNPGNFVLDGKTENLYQWLARQSLKQIAPPAPTRCNNAAPVTHYLAQTGTGEIYRPNGAAWKGGDTVKITGTNYSVIEFYNVGGDSCKDLVIMPQTTLTTQVFRIKGNSHHIKIWGGNTKYGIKVQGGSLAVSLSHHIWADNLEITGGSIGVYGKQDPEYGNPETYGTSGYKMTKLKFSNLWVHHIKGEGMYIGITSPDGVGIDIDKNGTIDTTISPIPCDSVEVSNCIVENTDWDGIQLSYCLNGNIISGNIVRRPGLIKKDGQMNHIIMGGRSTGIVISNTCEDGPAAGIAVFGNGLVSVEKNTLTNVANGQTAAGVPFNEPAMYFRMNHVSGAKLQMNVLDNVITGANNNGIVNATPPERGLPGVWKNNSVSGIRAGQKYLSSIADVITENTTTPADTVVTVPKAQYDSLLERYNAVLASLSVANASFTDMKNKLNSAIIFADGIVKELLYWKTLVQ